jgi:WD40 repeat protein
VKEQEEEAPVQLLTGYAKPIVALAVTPDGRRLFSAAQGQARVWEWDVASGAVARKLQSSRDGRFVRSLAVSPRGDFLASASGVQGVDLWRLRQEEAGTRSRPLGRPGTEGNTGPNPGVAARPDGRLVAAAYCLYGRGVYGFRLWDVAAAEDYLLVATRTGHEDPVEGVAFSPGGGVVATTSRDGTVRLWLPDVAAQDGPCRVLTPRVACAVVAFRPDGAVLAAAGARSVFLFDASSGALIEELQGHDGNVKALAYSPDGRHLAAACLDGVLTLRDAQTNEVVGRRDLEIGKLTALAWRPDSAGLFAGGEKLIAVCSLDELLGAADHRPKRAPTSRDEPPSPGGHVHRVQGVSYSPDGQTLLSWTGRAETGWWDLSGGAGQARPRTSPPPPAFVSAPQTVSWSPGGGRIAVSASLRAGLFGDVRTGAFRSVKADDGFVRYLGYLPSGRLLLVASSRRRGTYGWAEFEVRDAEEGERMLHQVRIRLPDHYATVSRAVGVGPGDRHVYVALTRHGVYRWAPAAEGEEEAVRLFEQDTLITGLAVRADERLALTTGGNGACLWSLPGGGRLAEMRHPLACSGAAFLPGGRVITACYDGVVRVWDEAGGLMHALDLGMGKVHAFDVSPDCMTFAAGVEKKSRIVLMDVPE